MSLPSINFPHLMFSKIWPGQDFIGQGHYGKVKSRSHHDTAHLHPLTNAPTKHQLLTLYCFSDIAQTRFSNSRSLRQGRRSNQGHTMMLHTYIPPTNVPKKYQLPTPYGFRDIDWTNFFPPPTRPNARPPIQTPWVKTIPRQPLRAVG